MKINIEFTAEEINALYRLWVANTTDEQVKDKGIYEALENKLCKAHIEAREQAK